MAPPTERRIRLKAGVLAVGSENGQRTAVPIPENAVVTIFAEADKVTELFWAGKELTVFTEDLAARGEVVSVARAAGS
jgi:hypothetical protein